jgi:hypothetical protein
VVELVVAAAPAAVGAAPVAPVVVLATAVTAAVVVELEVPAAAEPAAEELAAVAPVEAEGPAGLAVVELVAELEVPAAVEEPAVAPAAVEQVVADRVVAAPAAQAALAVLVAVGLAGDPGARVQGQRPLVRRPAVHRIPGQPEPQGPLAAMVRAVQTVPDRPTAGVRGRP